MITILLIFSTPDLVWIPGQATIHTIHHFLYNLVLQNSLYKQDRKLYGDLAAELAASKAKKPDTVLHDPTPYTLPKPGTFNPKPWTPTQNPEH